VLRRLLEWRYEIDDDEIVTGLALTVAADIAYNISRGLWNVFRLWVYLNLFILSTAL
jgi:hypothetical protein